MSIIIGVVGTTPLEAVPYALLTGGYLSVKPGGVRIRGYATQSILGEPMFGFDADNTTIGGFDGGAWATINGGS